VPLALNRWRAAPSCPLSMGIHQVVRWLGIHYGPNVIAGTNQPRKAGKHGALAQHSTLLMIVAALTVLGIDVVGVPGHLGGAQHVAKTPIIWRLGDWRARYDLALGNTPAKGRFLGSVVRASLALRQTRAFDVVQTFRRRGGS